MMYVVNGIILNVFVAKALLEGGKWTMAMCQICVCITKLIFSVKRLLLDEVVVCSHDGEKVWDPR